MIQYKTAVSCVCEWSFKNKKAKHLSVCFKASQGDIGGYEPQCDRTRFHLKDLIWSLGAEDEYALRDKVYPILFVYKLDIMKPVLCMSFQCVLNKMSSWAFCVLLSLHHALITFHVPVGLFIVGLLPVFILLPVSHSCIFSDHLFVLLMFLSVFSHISQPIFLWKPFSAFLKIKNKTILTGGS